MVSKRGRPPLNTSDPAVAKRVEHLIDVVFLGNQHRAAEALGVSQAYLSKIARGERNPGTKVLDALCRHPKVNQDWLLRGEGEALVASSAGTLPVATAIVPGAPDLHPHFFTGERHAVAAAQERDSRYWFKLSGSLSPRLTTEFSMLPNDCLLMETHEDHIQRIDVLRLHLCAFAITVKNTCQYALGRILATADGLQADLYEPVPDWHLTSTHEVGKRPEISNSCPSQVPRDLSERLVRRMGKLRKGSTKRSKESPLSEQAESYTIDRAVGVVLRLERPVIHLPMGVPSGRSPTLAYRHTTE